MMFATATNHTLQKPHNTLPKERTSVKARLLNSSTKVVRGFSTNWVSVSRRRNWEHRAQMMRQVLLSTRAVVWGFIVN